MPKSRLQCVLASACIVISLALAMNPAKGDRGKVFLENFFDGLSTSGFQVYGAAPAGMRWIFTDTSPECRVLSIHEKTGEMRLLFSSQAENCRSSIQFQRRGLPHGAPLAVYETNVLNNVGGVLSKEMFITDGTPAGTSQIFEPDLISAISECPEHKTLANGTILFTDIVTVGDTTTSTFWAFRPDGTFETVASTTDFFPIADDFGGFIVRDNQELWFIARPTLNSAPDQIGRLDSDGFTLFPLSDFGIPDSIDTFARLYESDDKLFLFDDFLSRQARLSILDPITMTGSVLRNFTSLPDDDPWIVVRSAPTDIKKIGEHWTFELGARQGGSLMWITDGTPGGTTRLAENLAGGSHLLLGTTSDRIIFRGFEGFGASAGWKIYSSSTTPSSAVIVASIGETNSAFRPRRVGSAAYEDSLIVQSSVNILATDGTEDSLEAIGAGIPPVNIVSRGDHNKDAVFLVSRAENEPNTLYRLSYEVFSNDFE